MVEKVGAGETASAFDQAIANMQYIAIMQYMNARAIVQAKEIRDDGSIVEIVIWELAAPLQVPIVLWHIGAREETYAFTTLDALLADFERDVENWRIA